MRGARMLAIAAVLAAGCMKKMPEEEPDGGPPPAGMKTQYVSAGIALPTTPTESQMFGLNLDGDPQNRPDNLLGSLVATLATQGLDLQARIDDDLAAGRLIVLHELQADDFTNWPNAGWQIFAGDPTANPLFDGTGSFTVDPGGPTDAVLTGSIAGGLLEARAASLDVRWRMLEGGPPLDLTLVGARLEADVGADGCTNGKLGGGIEQTDVTSRLIPWLADSIDAMVAADPGCALDPPACGSEAQTMLDLFDHGIACADSTVCPAGAALCDIPPGETEGLCSCFAEDCGGLLAGDGDVTAEELAADDLISSILSPDVDLLDAGGRFDPRQDMTNDSISIGIGFTCVRAGFPSP